MNNKLVDSRNDVVDATSEDNGSLFIDDGKNTIASQLAERIRQSIINGELAAGSKINLGKAKTIFAVSLSPLREALARLIPGGLVTFEDNRGYRVAPVSLANWQEITQLRAELEPFALRQSIAVASSEWEGEVMRSMHRLYRAKRDAADSSSIERWEVLHKRFHQVLIGGGNMPLLLDFCDILLNLGDRYRRSFLATVTDTDDRFEHNIIAQASVARDADYACATLREHITRNGTNIARHLAGIIG